MYTMIVKKYGKKAAGVTVETLLAITLAVVVLFFVLNIFGDNLKTMVASSGIQRMYDNSQKTTYSTQQYDPTSVNVQVLAEQGNTLNTLDDYKNKAIEKINHYANNPPTNEAEVMDLAMWASIARTIKAPSGSGASTYNATLLPTSLEGEFYTKYGIRIQVAYNNSYKTTITQTPNNYIATTKIVDFSVGTSNDPSFLNYPDNQFTTVKQIVQQFTKQ